MATLTINGDKFEYIKQYYLPRSQSAVTHVFKTQDIYPLIFNSGYNGYFLSTFYSPTHGAVQQSDCF